MANIMTKTRTNYVEITDIARFNEIIARCCAENEISVITHTKDDKTKYGFMCDGVIDGMPLPNDDCDKDDCKKCKKYEDFMCDPDYDFDAFVSELQKVIAPGDAMIITTISHERFKYLQGEVIVVTSEHCKSENIGNIGIKLAQKLLNNPDWETQNHY